MPLTIVAGPANAEKARVVLDGYASAIDRAPLLVVPTFADVDRYRRELAGRGIVFDVQVMRFAWLEDEIARRAGVRGRVLGGLGRERVAARAAERARLTVLAGAAATPGFPATLLRLVDELEEHRIDPGRWYAALRAWAQAEPARGAYAEDLGALYAAYRDQLGAIGRRDRILRTAEALDVLREEPARWGGTPVYVYGFDDLGIQQRDILETLGRVAEVMVSLAYEPGRPGLEARATTFEELRAGGAGVELLPSRAEHYEHPALHHLERALFREPAAGAGDDTAERPDPGPALRLLRGGGERAEIELVGAHVARLIREGVPPGEIAVVHRDLRSSGALIDQVFSAFGLPFALSRATPAGHTALGRGLLALLRCAALDGTAEDLVTWLRTPGFVERRELVDQLEAGARRSGARSAADARTLWEAGRGFKLSELDTVARAARRGPLALCQALGTQLERRFSRPFRGSGRLLSPGEVDDAAVFRALRSALTELSGLAALEPGLVPGPEALERTLAEVEVYLGERSEPDAVSVSGPGAVRARRVHALFVCGLQEGVFPRPPRPDPFLPDEDRRALNQASGLRLTLKEDHLGVERALFYAAVSRPTALLALSWHAADDEGGAAIRSLLVDDVLDVLAPGLPVEHRALGAAGFAPDSRLAPTEREALRGRLAAAPPAECPPVAPLVHREVLDDLAAREAWSASALELWVRCPVRWFVERHLGADELTQDPEAMARGRLSHTVLERVLDRIRTEAPGPLTPALLDRARGMVVEELTAAADGAPLGHTPERRRALLRRLEVDLLRYVEHALHAGSSYAPAHLELGFGLQDSDRPAVAVGEHGLRLTGRIDRVDTDAGGATAIVYDYKGKTAPPRARWEADGRLQIALYMLALPALLGIEAVGGLYQPLGAEDPRARGVLLKEADPGLDVVATDRAPVEEVAEHLAAALAAAEQAAEEIRAGRLESRPATCAFLGGCAHPQFCRCEGA